jgi:hypothetical protein
MPKCNVDGLQRAIVLAKLELKEWKPAAGDTYKRGAIRALELLIDALTSELKKSKQSDA